MKTLIGLLLQTENRYGTEYLTVRVVGKEKGADWPINLNNDHTLSQVYWDDYPAKVRGLALSDIVMDTFVMLPWRDSDPASYHYKAHDLSLKVKEAHSLDLRELKGYTKAFQRIDKACASLASNEPGDMLEAFAKAIGADFVTYRTNTDARSSYKDNDWRWMTIPQGKVRIRLLVENMENEARSAGKVQA